MSERHPSGHEVEQNTSNPEAGHEYTSLNHEKEVSEAENTHGSKEHLDTAIDNVERHAVSKNEFPAVEHESPKQHPVLHGLREKEMAWSRAMTRTRKKLSLPSKAFSKLTHTAVVDHTSEFIGKTIARPSGMLWGAVFAFVGSSIILWVTKRYGYEYNYLAASILFVAGAIIGTAAEGFWRLVHKKD